MTATDCRVAVVIPAYNEAGRLPQTITTMAAFLRQQPYRWRLFVVDDGSTDDTLDVARSLQSEVPELHVIANDHRGKAYAVRSGMLQVRADYAVFSDADLSVPIEELADMLVAFDAGADVVIGSREAPGACRVDEPGYRHLMGRVFSLVYRLLILPGIEDAQCGFKGFRGDAAQILFQHLRLYGSDAPIVRGGMVTGFDVEILYLARRWGYRIKELPVVWYYGTGSKVRATRDTPKMIADIVRIRWYALTGRYARTRPAR